MRGVRLAVTSRNVNGCTVVSIGGSMSPLDVAKEQIAYVKLRLGTVRNFSMKVRHSPYELNCRSAVRPVGHEMTFDSFSVPMSSQDRPKSSRISSVS